MPRVMLTPTPQTTTRLQTKRLLATVSGVALCAMLIVLMLYDRPGEGRLPGYDWRMAVVTDTTQVRGSGYLLDFPLRVYLQHPDFKGVAHGGKILHEMGYDLRFTRADGATPLYHQLKSYNPRRGEVEAWISVDTLHLGRPSLIYCYYSHAGLSTFPTVETAAHGLRGFMTGEHGPAPLLDAATQPVWLALEQRNHQNPGGMVRLGEPEKVSAPPPVTYEYLQVRERAGTLMLIEFATRQEHANDYFTIERSAEGMHFTPLDRMGGGDHSRELLRYTYTDARPQEGQSYYRIQQVNYNGDYSYSDLIPATFNPHAQDLEILEVAPVEGHYRLHYRTGQADHLTVTLYSATGVPIWVSSFAAAAPGTQAQLLTPPPDLAPGTYVLGVMGRNRKLITHRLERP